MELSISAGSSSRSFVFGMPKPASVLVLPMDSCTAAFA